MRNWLDERMARWKKGVDPNTDAPQVDEPMSVDEQPTIPPIEQEKVMTDENEKTDQHDTPAEETPQTQPEQRPAAVVPPGSALNALVIEAQVIDALESVYDPEIPVNIYELGLIYDVKVSEDGNVDVTMTLTAPGCPAAQTLPVEVEQKVRAIPGVTDVKVEITFDPPWEMSKMSDAARLQLGFM
jgi:FeS assembly SUF system protein